MQHSMKAAFMALALALALATAPTITQALPPPITEEHVQRLIEHNIRNGNENAARQWRSVLRKVQGQKKGAMTLARVRNIVNTKTGHQRWLWMRAQEAVKQAMIAQALNARTRFRSACFHHIECNPNSVRPLHFADGNWKTTVPRWKDVPTDMGHYGAWMERHDDGGFAGFPQVWAELPPGAEPYAMTSPTITATFTGEAKGMALRKNDLPARRRARIGKFTADIALRWSSNTRELHGILEGFRGPITEPDLKIFLDGIPDANGTAKVTPNHIQWSVGEWTATPYGNVTVPTGTTEPEGFVGTFDVRTAGARGLHMVGAYDATRLSD